MIYVTLFNGLILMRYALMRALRLRGQLYLPLLLSLFLFSAFRFEVGCDWSGYLHQYQIFGRLEWGDLASQREPLWRGLYVLQSWLDLPYPWINVFSSLIFFWGVHVLARRQPDPFTFLIFLFPILIIDLSMTAIRQGAAIGIMCIAFAAFIDRSLPRYITLTLVASALHSSALVFLLLAPLVRGQYTRMRLFSSVLLAIPGAALLLLGEAADIAATRYIDTGRDAAGAIFRVGFIGISALYFIYFLRRKWHTAYPADFKLVMVGSLLMIAALTLIPVSSIIADRLAYYLIPVQAIMFARIPFLPFRAEHNLHVALPYLGLLAVFLVWASFSSHFQQCYVPYQTWIFGFPDAMRWTF